MSKLLQNLDKKKGKDIKVLAGFVSIFCREKHRGQAKTIFTVRDELRDSLGDKELLLFPECQKLLNHGIAKRLLCPYNPKPTCKKCQTHCYAPGYRQKMREVMRFSGIYLIKRGRFDLIAPYLF